MIKLKKILSNNRYILKYIKMAVPYFIFLTIAISFTALVDTISNTWISKIVFDGMAKGIKYWDIAKYVLLLLIFMILSSFVRTWYNQKRVPSANEKIKLYIKSILYKKTKELDLECYENPDFYNKYTRALSQADSRALAVLSSVSSLSYAIITLFTLFTIILYLDPILIIFALIGSFLSILVNNKLGMLRYQYDYDRTIYDRKKEYINRVFYEPQYAKDIKMDNMYSYFLNSYKNVAERTIQYIKNRTNKIALLEFVSSTQMVFMQTLMIMFLTYRVYAGIISIGDYAALLNSTFSFMFQLNNLFNLIPQFYQHSLYIDDLKTILDRKPNIEKEEGMELNRQEKLTIEFKNVSFSYPGTENPVLRNVSFLFKAGEKNAIVGHNGAGKSTIIKLILRLYDVSSGEIRINGKNIKDYNIFDLRKHFSTVFQDYQSYSIPVADSILCREYKEQEDRTIIEAALNNSGLTERIGRLKKGIETTISKEFDEDGVILSGGEFQKLALAKAFTKKASVMVLDEPSSALDPISEYELNKTMLEIAKDDTVILISHRLSTTKDADCIYYMENGQLIEKGTHEQLISQNGRYAKMFHVQAMNYQFDKDYDRIKENGEENE